MKQGQKPQADLSSLGRAVKLFFSFYPVLAPLTIVCILFAAAVSSIPSLFIQNVITIIQKWVNTGDWVSAKAELTPYLLLLAGLYVLSILAITAQTQLMAVMTQGFLDKMRRKLFDGMQNLPIRYFDTHKFGDIMSYYTNDIDTLRQLVSQALPQIVRSGTILLTVLSIMIWYCVIMRPRKFERKPSRSIHW